MSTKSNEFNVPLTPDFALTADDRNFIVLERKLIDPTLAPNWKARIAANPTLDPTPRETWNDAGYYSLTSAGLAAALDSVRVRSVREGNYESLAEFIAEIVAVGKRIEGALLASGLREITAKLAS